ncbi:MAG: hypothetical protein ACM30G_15215 [Micromonosporaceae bacterium]
MMPWTVRPLGPWIGHRTGFRRESKFKAGWSDTLDLLNREIWHLGGRSFVLQIDVSDRWIRNDGALYARAQPNSPAVRVVFDSRHGTLTYATDQFFDWRDNVRAIALSLEALRKVDRYGVANSGEQYRGWAELPARPHQMTREQAAEFLAHWAGLGTTLELFNGFPAAVATAYRVAAKRVHPDVTGDDGDTMARLNAARDLLLDGAAA